MRLKYLVPLFYILFLMLPIYWLVAMSFKTTNEILAGFSLFPQTFTFANYAAIFTDSTWAWGYINSILYATINTVISVAVALPAAYAFSRYRFLGDKHLFFWPLDQSDGTRCRLRASGSSSSIRRWGCSTPISPLRWPTACSTFPWRCGSSKGSCVAFQENLTRRPMWTGSRFPHFFVRIFIPTIKAGVGVTAFFCFMFSWVELLLAKTLTAVEAKPIAAVMTRTASSAGYELGLLAAAGTLTIIPGAIVIYFVRNYIARGFALGRV